MPNFQSLEFNMKEIFILLISPVFFPVIYWFRLLSGLLPMTTEKIKASVKDFKPIN